MRAGIIYSAVIHSRDFCRTKLTADCKSKGGERQYNGRIDVYKKTLVSFIQLKKFLTLFRRLTVFEDSSVVSQFLQSVFSSTEVSTLVCTIP